LELLKKDFKLSKAASLYLTLIIFLIFVIFHNFTIISFQRLPEPSQDSRLSSLVIQNEINNALKYDLYDRINEEAVLSSFITICRTYYHGKNITLAENLIKKDILEEAGFKEITYEQKKDIETGVSADFLLISSNSLWYNPIVFSGKNYKKTGRYPLVTEPLFEREYPMMILFIKNKTGEQMITAEICGRYAVFYPAGFIKDHKGGQK